LKDFRKDLKGLYQERNELVPGKERVPRRKRNSKKGNERTQRQEKIVQRRKKEFKHGTRISKNPHYCRRWNWLHPQPPPPPQPLLTTKKDERLKDKGDPTRTTGMNEMITGIPNKIQNNPCYGSSFIYFSSFFTM
jgi:hypothetical protein